MNELKSTDISRRKKMNSNKARLRSIYGEMVNKPDLKDIEGFTTVTIEDIKLKDIEELPLK